MSATLMGAVFYVPDISTTDTVVLLALADHANDSGEHVYPGNRRLAAKSKMTVRGVQKCLARLQEANLLEPTKHPHGGRGMAKEWRINAELVYLLASTNGWANGAPGSRVARERVNVVPERVNRTTVKGERGSSQPSENHKEPDSLRLQTENPRRADETAGRYAARIAALIANEDAPIRLANQTSTGTETDATTVGTSPPPSSRQPTVRTRSDDQ